MASAAPAPAAEEPINSFPAEPAQTDPAPTALDFSQLEADVADVFGFGDGSSAADTPPAAAPAASEPAGEGAGQAPSPAPAAPTPTPPVAPQPAPTPAPAATPPAASPSPAPATPPTPSEDALRLASLEATVAALTSQLEQARANPQAQQTGQPAPAAPAAQGPGSTAEAPPQYNLSLPEQVTAALVGDDPAQAGQAIHWIVNSLATIVHNNLRTEYRQHFDNRVNALVAEASQTDAERQQQQTVEQAREQYFQAFPDHNNPLIQPIVAAEAGKLAAQFPNLAWNAEFMNSLGARVNTAIATLRGQAAPQPAAPTPTPAPRPAGMLPASGPAPQVPAGSGESQEDLVFSTMQDGSFW